MNPTVEDPHSVTFGLDLDRSDQPRFGVGGPLPNVNGLCVSDVPVTTRSTTCAAFDPSKMPPIAGQAFFNSGIIAPGGGTFDLQFSDDLDLGEYPFFSVIHPGQVGTLDVVGTTNRPSVWPGVWPERRSHSSTSCGHSGCSRWASR